MEIKNGERFLYYKKQTVHFLFIRDDLKCVKKERNRVLLEARGQIVFMTLLSVISVLLKQEATSVDT